MPMLDADSDADSDADFDADFDADADARPTTMPRESHPPHNGINGISRINENKRTRLILAKSCKCDFFIF